MILFNIVPFCLDKDGTNWVEYPSETQVYFIYFLIVTFIGMFSLQVFWFKKIVMGLLKALGIIKKPTKSKERSD